jgi:signal transduction histidine kinase
MTDEGGPFLTLTVANSGTRIEEERRPTLFEKYRLTADGRVTRGMGLYFCRLACDAHGGSLAVVDDPEFATMLVARIACGPRPAVAG